MYGYNEPPAEASRRESRNSHRFCDPFRGSDFYRRALHLEKCPNTKTGKVPRYIVILHFAAKPTPESEASDQYSGKIFFLQDGAPGKGFISCWKNENKIHATIHFGLKGSTLTVKKVEGLNNQDEMVVLYKDL